MSLVVSKYINFFFFFQAEDGIRDWSVTGVQTCALPICPELHTMLAEADFITLIVPHTPETEGLIGAAEFAVMKRSAVLINIARGQVVDEAALIAALREGRLAGAALDVFMQEPLPPDSPLWD